MQFTILTSIKRRPTVSRGGRKYTTYYIWLPKSLGIDYEKLVGKKIKVIIEIPDEYLKA
ncbi:hypothetical protein [Vulcanisaeta distributa]|uniref:hypothetical protein n=1 Tax=Vulcanisaeta distributa TaxID=164451 RepID=UPI001FB4C9FD|nr:hypothetical protein [Vulcanisaeta distributa]